MILALTNIKIEEDQRICEWYCILFIDFILLAFLKQIDNTDCYLILLVAFLISLHSIYTNYFFNDKLYDELFRLGQMTKYRAFMILVSFIGSIYLIFCYTSYLVSPLFDPPPSKENTFSFIYKKKGWIILIIDAVVGLIVLFFSVLFIVLPSDLSIDRSLGYVLFITGIGCFACCYFLSHYGKLYLIGITLCLIISIGLLVVYYILLLLSFGYNSVFR